MEVVDTNNKLSPNDDELQNSENTIYIKQENYNEDYDSQTSYKCDGDIEIAGHFLDSNTTEKPSANTSLTQTVEEGRSYDSPHKQESTHTDGNEFEMSEEKNMPEYKSWSTNSTKLLIHFYKKHRNAVGTEELKSMRKLWELIAQEVNKVMPHMKVSAANCENRWRVLERSYRKVIDNKNKTGRGRRTFEYAKEFEEIFGKKRRFHSSNVVLLSPANCAVTTHNRTSVTPTQYRFVTLDPQGNVDKSITCTPAPHVTTSSDNSTTANVTKHTEVPSTSTSAIRFAITSSHTQATSSSTQPRPTASTVRRTGVKLVRRDVLDKIRKDRLQYYKQRESISERKLALEEKKINIMERELKIRNELYRERNNIFQQFLEKNIHINLRSE